MHISAVNQSVAPVAAAVPVHLVDHTAEHRAIVQAVKAVNATAMFEQENELMFQMDQQAHRMVVQVVNRQSREVVSQIPAEYVLRLSEDLHSPDGR